MLPSAHEVVTIGNERIAILHPNSIQYPRRLATGQIVFDRPHLVNELLRQKVLEAYIALEGSNQHIYEE